MLFEVEVALIVQPGLVPKQFLQGNGLSLYFWLDPSAAAATPWRHTH